MPYDPSTNDLWSFAKQFKHNYGFGGLEDKNKWLRAVGWAVPEGVDPKRWYAATAAEQGGGAPILGALIRFPWAKAGKAAYNVLKPGPSKRTLALREIEEQKRLAAQGQAQQGGEGESVTDNPELDAAIAEALQPYDPTKNMSRSDKGFWDRVAASNPQPPQGYQMARKGQAFDPDKPTVAVPGFGEGNVGGPGSGTGQGGVSASKWMRSGRDAALGPSWANNRMDFLADMMHGLSGWGGGGGGVSSEGYRQLY